MRGDGTVLPPRKAHLMYFYGSKGFTLVSSGKPNGRSFAEILMDGKITIRGSDGNKEIKRVVEVRDGEVWDNRLLVDGRTVHRIAYGRFEKKGRDIVRFRKGTGTGKHGKARRVENLFGHNGVCHSWYNRGRLVRQLFCYDNGKKAYEYNGYGTKCDIRDYDGKLLYEVTGLLDGRLDNAMHGSHSVFSRPMTCWFSMNKPFEVKKNGKVFYKGEVKNRQRVGEWFEDGKQYFYVNGVQIPKKLYETPPEKLDPMKILKLPNAQTRMAMMEKIGTDRIAGIGRVIHKDGDMRLYDIPKYDVRILRVRCTTTKVFYYLRVPKDSKRCEEARQWTFHVGNDFREPIKFAVET